MAPVRTLAETLQAETYDQNVRIGTLPFFKAVAAQHLPVTSYVILLRNLLVVYETFEQAVAQAPYPAVRAAWNQHLNKAALLRQDNAAFAHITAPEVPAVSVQSQVMAQQIRLRATHDPISLLGSAYILAIWDMGGATLSAQMQQDLHLTNLNGISFLSSFDSWGQEHWPIFAACLNAAMLDSESEKHAVRAAQEMLDGLEELFDLLHPLNENPPSQMVTLLNPLAGNHKIPDDLREIQAALRAGERTALMFPYFERRYGDRGRRFSRSDSGWLATLADESQAKVNQQTQWLARLLAMRGMPQWVTECHLMVLHEELVQVHPEKSAIYATLAESARQLAEQRRAHLSDAALMELDRAFDARVGPEWSAWMPHGGGLLAAAVADERGGVTHVLENIVGWMSDKSRFPAHWVEAVEATVSTAQKQAQ
jgi:heme oxygenase